jgi:DNA-binding response OmpR family regulator
MSSVLTKGQLGMKSRSAAQKKHILIVDDERDVTESIKAILQKHGYWVETADSVQAYSSFRPHFYDLIILDYRMSTMDGFALFQEIRRIDSKQKVCFITAYEGLEKKITYLWQNKANSIFEQDITLPLLKKPFDSATLLEMVSGVIGE